MRRYWDILLGGLLILYVIDVNLISSTKIAFSYPVVALGIIMVVYHFIKDKLALLKIFQTAKVIMCIFLVCFLGIEVAIISYPKSNIQNTDYILVLGAGLSNGKIPSLILQGRLEAAIKCLKQNEDAYIVLSGGKGNDEDLPEAHAMSIYLQDRGIDKNKILIEDKSQNTNENFKFSKEKIEELSGKTLNEISVKIITTDFHALRSSILAKRNGYVKFDNYSSTTVWYLIPITYTREAFAIVKSLIFDR
ncbi:protein of unknown function DUF218 [Clostridium sp. DL-VIII]|uniref:YdcF family protein n=1 Tax=Clostridium sp. DL-VIII TaxID=641107 RepID=UPI00023AFCF9|nr:YdcF family protein [Clostridium sp. DL-VIII]EHJ00192.1 protein of unknown function DUF218 [Clostridium sp. DL-VIII]